ncbi:restriction endonuclease subunit S [Janibacter sp. Y6]|uniref:restriction endonuclease subunit S n=1 Tax=Janibacter sp. Y6 TaxID=2913552 RepID=UPI0034A36426
MTAEPSGGFKGTGHDWLPAVPVSWSMMPAKALFSDRREASATEDEHLTPSQKYGVVTQAEYMEITGTRVVLNLAGADTMKRVRPGDFVIHLRSFQGGIERSAVAGKVSLAYTVLTPRALVHGPFFRWLLKSDRYVQALRVTVNQLRDGQSIRYQDFGKIHLPVPSLPEQRAIADYLDRETAKIDALIEKQTKLIDRLRERRSQLRGNLVMARSHTARETTNYWFGSIPEHWSTPRLSHKASVVLGRMINAAAAGDDDVQLPYLAAGSIQPDALVLDDSKTLAVPAREVSKYELRAADVVVVEGGAGYGRSHVLPEGIPGWAFQNHVARVRARKDDVDTRYIRAVLEMCRLSGFFEANNRTATLPSLSREVLGALRIPCPPVDEQREIADHLDRETAKIDALIAKAERFTELARERRSALVTAAVTGQIDVTKGAA